MKTKELFYGIIAEVSFYGFIYYASYLLKVDADLWISSLILLILANMAIMWCPVIGKYCKNNK